ncbi:MAG: glycolate oxidase subunit GlcE [Azospirillum sp.]|nr:glycolate oxidase subunit GlcE [Azospirillum sp.]
MTETVRPRDEAEVVAAVEWAAGNQQPVELVGAGSKRGWGRPVEAQAVLDLSGLSGVTLYEPNELVLTARPGTTLGVLEDALAGGRQHLAFEPPDLGPLLGRPAGQGTLGGAIACNLAGPRRIKDGAARDHFLGVKAVSGRGEAFKAGGRVVKNVTGYDVCKLLAGSFGTLAAMTEITVKVLPAPEQTRTLVIAGLDDLAAVRALTQALQSPHEISGAAHLPAALAARSGVAKIAGIGSSATLLRLEGFGPSVKARVESLQGELAGFGDLAALTDLDSKALWREIADVSCLVDEPERPVWRLSVPPAQGAQVVGRIRETLAVDAFFDWGGGLIWLAAPADAEAAGAGAVRAALTPWGGQASLVRASAATRASLPVFQPEAPTLAALSARVRAGFDPLRILNRGRLTADS